MAKEERISCPQLLELQTQAVMLDIDRYMGGFYQKPLDSLNKRGIVWYSLCNFTTYINNLPLGVYLADYLKEGAEIPDGDLSLKPVLGDLYHSPTLLSVNRGMYLDGAYGFIVYLQPDNRGTKPLLLAATSFFPGTSLYQYSDGLVSYRNVTNPVIVQLQSQHRFTNHGLDKAGQADQTLKSLRWEHALIALSVQWAQSVRLPAIHILPSYQNRYFRGHEAALKMRYDVSAERCGFKKDERGLYTLSLLKLYKQKNSENNFLF